MASGCEGQQYFNRHGRSEPPVISGYHQPVAEHYEKYPYPHYPWYSLGSWRQLESVDASQWGAQRAIRDIWIAGCGTIAPIMFGRRNERARIWGTDLSEQSLGIAQRRLNLLGIRNVHLKQEDLFDARYHEAFDAIDAYGVIHHTVSPQRALEKLAHALRPGGVLRLMVYSQEGRAQIEGLRREVKEKKLADLYAVREFLSGKEAAKKEEEFKNNSGIADALLNPIVHVFDEQKFRVLLASEASLNFIKVTTHSNYICHGIKI